MAVKIFTALVIIIAAVVLFAFLYGWSYLFCWIIVVHFFGGPSWAAALGSILTSSNTLLFFALKKR